MDNVYFKDAETFYDEMAQPIKGEVNTDSKSLTYRQNMPVAQELSYITMLLDEVNKRVHAKTALKKIRIQSHTFRHQSLFPVLLKLGSNIIIRIFINSFIPFYPVNEFIKKV